jgi:hypothetical protein
MEWLDLLAKGIQSSFGYPSSLAIGQERFQPGQQVFPHWNLEESSGCQFLKT